MAILGTHGSSLGVGVLGGRPEYWFGARIHGGHKLVLRERITLEFLRQHAVDEDDDAVSDRRRFFGIARGKENYPPRLCKAPHDSMHFPLRGHIYAARGIVEHKQRWRCLDP